MGMPETVFGCVIDYIHDARDREAVSLVCKFWCETEVLSRKHVTIVTCYGMTPQQLWHKFKYMESLKLKPEPERKPVAMLNRIPNCGEHATATATPWIKVLPNFRALKEIFFKGVLVIENDLELLSHSQGNTLVSLKIKKYSGFSTNGLRHIAQNCKSLTTFSIEKSNIIEKDGDWLHQFALNNRLGSINFHLTYLFEINPKDLEIIGRRCRLVKVADCYFSVSVGMLQTATALEDFTGSFVGVETHQYDALSVSPSLCSLGLYYAPRHTADGVPNCITTEKSRFALFLCGHCALLFFDGKVSQS